MFRVLYVDDEPDLLEIGKLFLEKDGRLSVDVITSAPGALSLMASTSYDAIISDYQMPEMDGIEFLKQVRSSGNSIPFILFTGRGREEIVIKALNAGADSYLQKGGEPQAQFAELQSKILQSIYRRQAEEQVEYLSRINSLLSQVNKNIVHIPDRDNLFKAICAVAIEYGKFRMAWIGIIDRKTRRIKPAASAGIGVGEYLSNIVISADDIPEGRGPTGRAVREGRSVVANNIREDPAMIPWHDAAEKFGYRSSGSFPICCREKVIGAFSLYAPEPEFFSPEEVALLEEVAGDISFAIDVLERERERSAAVEALARSEERLKFALEGANDGLWDVWMDTGEMYLSPRGCEILGYTPEELPEIARVWNDLVYPDDLPRTQAALDAYLGGRTEIFSIEQRLITKTGESKWILTRGKASARNNEGRVLRMTGTHSDITEQKKAENDLRAANELLTSLEEELRAQYDALAENQKALTLSEEKYRTLVETSFDGIVIHQNGIIVYANATAVRLLGAGSADEFLGKSALSFVHPDCHAVVTERMASAMNGEPQQIVHEKFLRADGNIIDVDVVAIPFLWKNAPAVHIVFRDITERKKADDALRQSEEKNRWLAAIVESSDDAIIGKTLDGIITSWNAGAEKIYGYPAREVIGKSIVLLIPPGRENELPGILEKIRRGEHISHYETIRIRKDAKVIQISLTISPILDTEGHIAGASTIARDITGRKVAEEHLKKAEENYRHIFETALEGIYQITPKGKFLTANPAMARILGYDSAEDLTTTVTDTARQLWVRNEQRKTYIRRLREHNVVQNFECEYYRKDKSLIWVSLTTHTVRGPGGNVLLSEGILTDITRRKTVESELIEREAEYRTILRTAMDGFGIISQNGRFLDINDAFCQMTGYTREELLARSLADIEARETSDEIAQHSRDILSKGADRFETRYRRKDGSVIDAEVSVVVSDRHSGQFITFHHDITEHKRAQAELENARSNLEQKVLDRTRELKGANESLLGEIALRNKAENEIVASLKEKEMLLKEIHHRVKNNLQVVSSLLFMQARSQKDEKVKEILKESQDRIKSIALVHEKLYLSKDFDQIDYADYLRKITDHLFESYQVDPKQVSLNMNAEKAVLHIDKAVPCSLIINEMISNSLKHAFPGGRKGVITIDFRKSGEKYIVTYSDDGIGLPDSVTFDRTESLGMQLIRGLTKQINGSIELDRTSGTKYTVTFPV
jgi:PAS domain S-box-containing protein